MQGEIGLPQGYPQPRRRQAQKIRVPERGVQIKVGNLPAKRLGLGAEGVQMGPEKEKGAGGQAACAEGADGRAPVSSAAGFSP